MSFVSIECSNEINLSEDEFDFSLSSDEITSIQKEIDSRKKEMMKIEMMKK